MTVWILLTVFLILVCILEKGAYNEDDSGEEDKDEGDDSHYPGEEAEARILEQIPPPLLGPAEAGGGEDEHVVLLPHRGLLHLVLAAVVDLLAARLHEQLADAPVGELLAKCDGTSLWRTVKFPDPVKVEDCSHAPGVAIKKVFIVSVIPTIIHNNGFC